MTRTRHEPVAHDELVRQLNAAADGMQQTLDDLDTAVAELRGQWSGEARDAYDRAHRDWTTTMTRLRRDLSRITDGAASAGARLAQADVSVQAIWT